MKNKQKVVPLTIFLIKEGMRDRDVIDEEVVRDVLSLPVAVESKEMGMLYVKHTPAHPPSWAKFFFGSVDLKTKELKNSAVSAIFLTRAGNRLFALSFGHGRHLLNPGCYEERFGLRVTLNSVDPDLLRAVDVTTLEANPFHGKRQAARAAPLGEFGLNLDQDLLRAVTGKPLNENLGTQMTGIDSLSVRVRTDLKSLRALLVKYLAKSSEDNYRKRFSWVDHVAEVRDQKLCDKLFASVLDALGKKDKKDSVRIWAAIPEAVDWNTFDHFRFGTPTAKINYDDIDLNRILEVLEGEALSMELLKKKRVFCIAQGQAHPIMDWTFLHCLTAEMRMGNELYLLNAGTWYRINSDYAKQIDADLENIQSATLPVSEWGDENEAAYNSRMASRSKGQLALMDRVMVSHPGMASPIEFCDLYSADRRMIHVKRYGQSSVLSHLFAQGLVSAASALSDVEFRKAVNEKLPESHKFSDPDERISANRYEVCFAIGSSDVGSLKLPFFSRVTLRNAYRTLTQTYGFRVTLTKIPVKKFASLT